MTTFSVTLSAGDRKIKTKEIRISSNKVALIL